MDDPKNRVTEEINRLQRSIAESIRPKIPDISSMMTPYIPPSEAELVMDAIGEEVQRWKANTPEHKHLVVILGTPDGGTMDVETFQSYGRHSYRATGYVNGEFNMAVGHVATLAFRGFYEDNASGKRVGFKSFNQSRPKSEQSQPDNK